VAPASPVLADFQLWPSFSTLLGDRPLERARSFEGLPAGDDEEGEGPKSELSELNKPPRNGPGFEGK
jgi:hypothetical protein